MRSIATIYKWVILPLWASVAIPVLVDFLQKWLDRNGAYEHPGASILNALAVLAQLPGVYPAALVLSGLLAGAWLDVIFRKLDGSRRKALVDLGVDIRSLGRRINDRQNGFRSKWPANIIDLKPSLLSSHLKLTKRGIWSPGEILLSRADGAQLQADYLETVGTLLREGQFTEAKEKALELKASLGA
jgi:hypothetical protein